MNNFIVTKKYYIKLPKEKINTIFIKIKNSLNDEEFKQEFLEEVVGNLSSTGFISFFSMVGGGVALFVNPIAGTFILISSIAYGSWLKVCCGQYYRHKRSHKRNKQSKSKIFPSSESFSNKTSLENNILNTLKKWTTSSSMKFIRTKSAKYGFIRLTSNNSRSTSRKVAPEIIS